MSAPGIAGSIAEPDSDRVAALRAIIGLIDAVLEGGAGELNLVQLRALIFLAEGGTRRSVDFAVALGIDPSTASRLCSRLEQRGLVVSRRSPRSRREVEITLSAEGRKLLDAVLSDGIAGIQNSRRALEAVEGRPSPLQSTR